MPERVAEPLSVDAGDARRWYVFVAWCAVGALLGLAVAAVLTIGVFVAPVAVIAALILARLNSSRADRWGLLAGPALVLLWIAFLNREGPGTVCSTDSSGGGSCTEMYSPWPFAVVALLLMIGAVVGRARTSGRVS